MFDDRDNIVGVLLLGLCAVIGGVMVWAIMTDTELEYTGPEWLAWAVGALFLAGTLYGLFVGFGGRRRSGGAPQWPDVGSGRRPWWKFWDRR
jgi:drug/metabolite transporter (DMT)-like permease